MGNKKTKKTFMGKDGYHLPNEIVDYQFWWKLVRVGVRRTHFMDEWAMGGRRWDELDESLYKGWGLEVGRNKFLKMKWKEWWSGDRWRDLFAVSIQTKVLQEVIEDKKTGDEYDKIKVTVEFEFDGDKEKILSQFNNFMKNLVMVDELSEMGNRTSDSRQLKIPFTGKHQITPENAQIKYYGMLGIVTLQESKITLIEERDWGSDIRDNLTGVGVTKTISTKQIWELFLERTSDKVGMNIPYHTAHENHKGKSKDEVWNSVMGTVRKNLSRGDKLLNNVCRGEFTGKYY